MSDDEFEDLDPIEAPADPEVWDDPVIAVEEPPVAYGAPAEPPPAGRAERRGGERRRTLMRKLLVAAVFLGLMVVLWIWVFPWVDRTYVNRPSISL